MGLCPGKPVSSSLLLLSVSGLASCARGCTRPRSSDSLSSIFSSSRWRKRENNTNFYSETAPGNKQARTKHSDHPRSVWRILLSRAKATQLLLQIASPLKPWCSETRAEVRQSRKQRGLYSRASWAVGVKKLSSTCFMSSVESGYGWMFRKYLPKDGPRSSLLLHSMLTCGGGGIISVCEKDAGALHEDRHVGSPHVQPPVEGREVF